MFRIPTFLSCIYFMLQPVFIRADASRKTNNVKQQPTSPKQVRRFSWTHFIELTILLSVVIGVIWLISKMVTPQVVTAISVIAGFLILRFIVSVILKVKFRPIAHFAGWKVSCHSIYTHVSPIQDTFSTKLTIHIAQ